jgi:ATP-binding protein involved in chromosome partitioning
LSFRGPRGSRSNATVSLLEEITERLDRVAFPGFPHSIVRYGLVVDAIRERVSAALQGVAGVATVRIATAGSAPAHSPGQTPSGIPGVRRIVAVSSAKGGVGKSTVAINLAVALRKTGATVALLDADVYGPSAPLMLGIDARPRSVGQRIVPIEGHGVEVMSMGFFLDDASPVIWRGPMVMGLIRQFLRDVEWGTKDYLVVDMPPGTGDTALTLAQQVPLSGAVIVTTPQEVALADVERGIAMFRQLQVPVLGIVENMSEFVCPDCGEREEIFGEGGGEALARQFRIELLARIPLVGDLRRCGDEGTPLVAELPDHPVSRAFFDLARSIDQALTAAEGPSQQPE